MFWADKIVENLEKEQLINDSWTPSGMVHMGSLKGPVIHDTLYRLLKEKGVPVRFLYGFDDADPIDGLPKDLVDSHSKYLGVPIYIAPSPDGNGSFGDYFGNKMKKLLDELGIQYEEVYKTSELYKKGFFNKSIQHVLDNAQKVRDVYSEIYKKNIPSDWFPLQVVCPDCGKLGTTKVTGWDGNEVSFNCDENLVKWAKGCGKSGNMSPFDGNGKMPWKVEWAAKWWSFNVTIEGAGKDHASAGGSYDVAMLVCEKVFNHKPPMKLAYEFFLSGGKKMSSSKGLGLTGEDLVEVLGPQRSRYLMLKTPPNEAVEFSPHGTDTISKIFDDYQHVANSEEEEHKRLFSVCQKGETEKVPGVRFSTLAQWIQMPNMNQEIKKEGLEKWAEYARIWIAKYAPEKERFEIKKEMPESAKNLTDEQKKFLKKLAEELDKYSTAEDLQKQIYEYAKELGVVSKDAFIAIYLSLLGKDHGPKVAWLMLSLDKEFVKNRFNEAANTADNNSKESIYAVQQLNKSEIFMIDNTLKQRIPTISVGVAVIKNVSIQKTHPDLEKEKEELLKSLESLTTEELGQFSEIQDYRKLYKETGVDWHSRRPSPEALLRRIALKKGLYTVNTCVDAYNLVVMKNRVSIGAFDLDTLDFPTVLRTAKAGETIHLLGDESPTEYKDGEIAYFDQKGGFNIDFNYRDAQRTAVKESTKNLYINVDGVYNISPQKVQEVLQEAVNSIIKYCGGTLETFGIEIASN